MKTNNKIVIYTLLVLGLFALVMSRCWDQKVTLEPIIIPENGRDYGTDDLDDIASIDVYEEVDDSSRFERLRY